MKVALVAVVLLFPAVLACSAEVKEPPASEKPAETPEGLVKLMNQAIAEFQKKPEHTEGEVTIQHLLVGVAGPLPGVTRTPSEAENLTAVLYSRAQAGEDFDSLVKNSTDDQHPGIYTLSLTASDPPKIWRRNEMVPAFGDVAWRLQVDEIGIAPYDGSVPGQKSKSPFGYHIVKRLK